METITADSVLMERMSGGKGVLKVGDIVTPKPEHAGVKYGWTEWTVQKFSNCGFDLKSPDGKKGFGPLSDFLLTSHSELQAQAQLESIREMVGALKYGQNLDDENDGRLSLLKTQGIEEAQLAIQQDPLSVEVRSDWWTLDQYASESKKPSQFRILLCTGGPAVQIIGELSEHCEPEKARLQHQDWGTPWTDYWLSAEDEETLLAYCREFYFGE